MPVFIAVGVVLEDLRIWAVGQEVWDTLDVVWMPVREQRFVDCDVVLRECGFERCDPCVLPFAAVNKQTFGACADDVRVRAL